MRQLAGILSNQTQLRSMPFSTPYHREFDPPAPLRNAIKCFWWHRRDADEAAAAFEVLPDGYVEIIFTFGSACSVWRDEKWHQLPSPFMMGLLNQPATLRAEGQLEVLAVRCHPWAVFDLLGLPAHDAEVHVFEHPVAGLQSTLGQHLDAGRIEDAIACLAAFFVDTPGVDRVLSKAGAAMSEAHGTMPVRDVAAAAHASVRTLERKFKQSSGHTVKDVSGLMRFEQVRNRLFTTPGACLAGLAQDLGYTDQSHLSREFKRYSGTTPAAFARRLILARSYKPG